MESRGFEASRMMAVTGMQKTEAKDRTKQGPSIHSGMEYPRYEEPVMKVIKKVLVTDAISDGHNST